MALIIKSDQVTGSEFAPGVFRKLLLEKEKTGQERLQIKQFEFLEEIQVDFKTEASSLSWLMPLTSNLKYNGLDLDKNSNHWLQNQVKNYNFQSYNQHLGQLLIE